MIGKKLLWVAKQHGHSVTTMLNMYAAWTEGAKESDVEAIRRAMESSPHSLARIGVNLMLLSASQPQKFGTGSASEGSAKKVSRGFRREIHGGNGGTRTRRISLKSTSY